MAANVFFFVLHGCGVVAVIFVAAALSLLTSFDVLALQRVMVCGQNGLLISSILSDSRASFALDLEFAGAIV